MIYLQLFIEFFKTGLFAVGGGLATLPFLYDISERYGWFSAATLTDMVAVAESTPGPIGVNMATFAGFTTGGYLGAFIATFALVLPSYIVILLVTKLLDNFADNKFVKSAFYGIRPVVTAMIAASGYSIIKTALLTTESYFTVTEFFASLNPIAIALFIAVFILYEKFKKHPIFYIVACAVIGMIIKL